MEKDRLAAFMDAVLAIIMTILVLELPKPEPVSFEAIKGMAATYFCYALSFFWLGTMWVHIHSEWQEISRISQSVVWHGIFLLFFSSWIPYTISLVNENPHNKVAQVFYGIAVFAVTFANIALSKAVEKCHDKEDEDEAQVIKRINLRRKKLYPDIGIKLVGMALTLTVFPMAISFAVMVAMVWMLIPIKEL